MSNIKYAYISMPMADKTTEEIVEKRNGYAKQIYKKYGMRVIDSILSDPPKGVLSEGMWYLGESIKLMSYADAYFMAPDWENYRGCIAEHEIMLSYGSDKPIYNLGDMND